MKELQHEFHSGSDGFPCFDFPRLLLQEVFPLEWRRNRLKHSLAQKKKTKKKVSVPFVTLLFFESLAILSPLSICSWHRMPRILQLMVFIVTPAIEL